MIDDSPIIIIVDDREEPSGLPQILTSLGANVTLAQLQVGDYLLASDTAVERKTVGDLLSSIYDGRLFRQCDELAKRYAKPLLLIEGNLEDLPELTRNPKAAYGAMASLVLNSKISLIYTPSITATAELLVTMVGQLSRNNHRRPKIKKVRKKGDLVHQQLEIVTSLPFIGETLGERLLQHFKTPRAILTAPLNAIAAVKGVGQVRALRIRNALTTAYSPSVEESDQQTSLS